MDLNLLNHLSLKIQFISSWTKQTVYSLGAFKTFLGGFCDRHWWRASEHRLSLDGHTPARACRCHTRNGAGWCQVL